jgi:hypothetical protein
LTFGGRSELVRRRWGRRRRSWHHFVRNRQSSW